MSLEKRKKLGRYELIERIAEGGMSQVWLARAIGFGGFEKTVVLKTILPKLKEDPGFLQMFVNEARLAALLNHPNIVQIFDLGKREGHYFIAMEYIDGQTLRQIKRRLGQRGDHIPPWFSLFVASSVCNALEHAHNVCAESGAPLNIVHRDVTPENIMISFQGTVKMLDFGIATAALESCRDSAVTLRGKHAYMAPEMVTAARAADRQTLSDKRTDIYSLGVVLYEILTGRRPFDAPNPKELLGLIVNQEPAPPSALAPWIPVDLENIVLRALCKDIEARYQSAGELRRDIDEFLALLSFYPTERDLADQMGEIFFGRRSQGAESIGRTKTHKESWKAHIGEAKARQQRNDEPTAQMYKNETGTKKSLENSSESNRCASPSFSTPPVETIHEQARRLDDGSAKEDEPPPTAHFHNPCPGPLPRDEALALWDAGLEMAIQHDYQAALGSWLKAIERDPENPRYHQSVERLKAVIRARRARRSK